MGLLESASARCRNADWLSYVDGRKASLTMTTTIVLEDRVAGIESKLDLILEELSHLRRLRNEAEDLVSDVTMVAKDALREITNTCTSMDLRPKELGELLRTAILDARLLTET